MNQRSVSGTKRARLPFCPSNDENQAIKNFRKRNQAIKDDFANQNS